MKTISTVYYTQKNAEIVMSGRALHLKGMKMWFATIVSASNMATYNMIIHSFWFHPGSEGATGAQGSPKLCSPSQWNGHYALRSAPHPLINENRASRSLVLCVLNKRTHPEESGL